jgi:hypothetical protein
MAVLYGKVGGVPAGEVLGLPTANELDEAGRRKLESDRLKHLLRRLAARPGFAGSGLPTEVPTSGGEEPAEVPTHGGEEPAEVPTHGGEEPAEVPAPGEVEEAWEEALRNLNLGILCALAATRQETLLAYELGRSLRDTVNPPASALSRVFDRDRIATIQGWLAELSSDLPLHTAAVVAASLGRWSEFAAVAAGASNARLKNGDSTQAAKAMEAQPAKTVDTQAARTMGSYLLRQGDLWLMLLTGARSASGLLSPQGYVAAGELALRRSAAIIRGILRHYWAGLLVGAAALGGVLYLAITYLGGAAKVWTSIVAIAGSLGITVRAVASTITRLSAEAERPVFAAAEEDAMAWAITTMPQLRGLTPRQVRQLRKAGIARTSSLGRI